MTVHVEVLPDGSLQLTDGDGMVFAPITVEAAQALAHRVPDAQAACARQGVTAALQGLLSVLSMQNPTMQVVVTATPTAIGAVVDSTTFAELQQTLGLAPDPVTGALVHGPVTITKAA